MKLTREAIRQRRSRFVREYLLERNATKAAISAGYSVKGASVTGTRLLNDASVRARIEAANSRINVKLDITVERIKLELARLCFFDPLEFWNEDGTAKPLHEINVDARRCIAGLEVAELFTGTGEARNLAGYIKKFKLADKGANLERLGRHLQMFPTKVEVTGNIELTRTDDTDIDKRISDILHELGLAAAINDAGRTADAHAGEGKTNGKAENPELLPR